MHSFQTILADLATIVRNRMRPRDTDDGASFEMTTTPTAVQCRVLDLLGVSLRV